MKLSLICVPLLLFSSCNLFEKTPASVLAGQREVYQSVLIGEENSIKLIDIYTVDCKKAVAYHVNYLFQLELKEIEERDPAHWSETEKRGLRILEEEKKDKELKKAYHLIDVRASKMRVGAKKRHKATLRLVASVYSYLSTNPIEVDNIPFYIDRLNKTE